MSLADTEIMLLVVDDGDLLTVLIGDML